MFSFLFKPTDTSAFIQLYDRVKGENRVKWCLMMCPKENSAEIHIERSIFQSNILILSLGTIRPDSKRMVFGNERLINES